jgi:hypothetical protein
MSKRRSRDRVVGVTRRIGRPVGEGSATQDLPAVAWARLLAVTLAGLWRARPEWASITAGQVDMLIAAWRVFAQDRSLSPAERDLRLEEALEQIEGQPPWPPEPAAGRRRAARADRPGKRRARRARS